MSRMRPIIGVRHEVITVPWHAAARLFLDDQEAEDARREVGTGSLNWLLYFATTNPLYGLESFSIETMRDQRNFTAQDLLKLALRWDRPSLFGQGYMIAESAIRFQRMA